MRQLTFAEVEQSRQTPGESLLLFITERCPVGCAHCSVDSRHDSPTITDFELFENIVQGVCAQPMLKVVGISGGEPFVERRGLTLAVDYLVEAKKDIVLYTSGIWANANIPQWARSVISKASCVFLSTDAFHSEQIDDERFIRAAQTIAAENVWIIVQVLDMPEMVEKADTLLKRAFGGTYAAYAELHLTQPLTWGRGANVFFAPRPRHAATFGPCTILASPVVRYDGVLTACCNEGVIMGRGPDSLRARCVSAEEASEALTRFGGNRVLKVMNQVGVGTLTQHPRFADLAQQRFSNICQLCWAIQERSTPEEEKTDPLLAALTFLPRMIAASSTHA